MCVNATKTTNSVVSKENEVCFLNYLKKKVEQNIAHVLSHKLQM